MALPHFETAVSAGQAYATLAEMADVDTQKYPDINIYMREVASISTRTTKLENYKRIYDRYVREMGNNEFALYNTLTHISTHGAAKAGDKQQAISTFGDRSKRVTALAQKHLVSYAIAA